MSDFITKFKNFLTGGDEWVEEEAYDSEVEDVEDVETVDSWFKPNESSYSTQYSAPVESAPVAPQATPVVTTPVYQQPSSTVVMLSPYDIRTSQIVCDHIRDGHIVICNLTASSNNQRVVDYISGGVYAFDGKIEPTAVKTTFVCTPKNVDLIVDTGVSESGTKVSAL